jgi:hypothetical protein
LADIVMLLAKEDPIFDRIKSEAGKPADHPIMMSVVLIFSYIGSDYER